MNPVVLFPTTERLREKYITQFLYIQTSFKMSVYRRSILINRGIPASINNPTGEKFL